MSITREVLGVGREEELRPQTLALLTRKNIQVFYALPVQFKKRLVALMESEKRGEIWGFLGPHPFVVPNLTSGIFVAQVRGERAGVIMDFALKRRYHYLFCGGVIEAVESRVVKFEDGSVVNPGVEINLIGVKEFRIKKSHFERKIVYQNGVEFYPNGVMVKNIEAPDLRSPPRGKTGMMNDFGYFKLI